MIPLITLLPLLAPSPVAVPAVARHPDYDAVLVCDEPEFDVGTVWVGPKVEHYFPLRNEGSVEAWARVYYALAGTQRRCEFAVLPGQTVFVRYSLRSELLRGTFWKSATVRLISPPSEAVCERCGKPYLSSEHLGKCGPSCYSRAIYDWCIAYQLPQ